MIKYLLTSYLILISCLPQQSKIYTQLHENIYEINNQYFYGAKVHTYLIELQNKVLLFDIPTYSDSIKEFVRSFDKPVYAILSHGSCGIEDGTRWQDEIDLKVYAHKNDENHPWIRMKPDALFEEIPFFDSSIEVIHVPGHSAGSICVLEETTKSLFTGDTFYGNDQGLIRDFTTETQRAHENLERRIESCKKLLGYDFQNVYPFHYGIIKGTGKEQLVEFLSDK